MLGYANQPSSVNFGLINNNLQREWIKYCSLTHRDGDVDLMVNEAFNLFTTMPLKRAKGVII